MTCTCRVYDLDKIPCEHALAVITKRRNLHLENCASHYYTKNDTHNAYAKSVNPGDIEWEQPSDIPIKKCFPPVEKRGAGRPKKSRYLSALEKAMGSQYKQVKHEK